jgi:hypothetical protein
MTLISFYNSFLDSICFATFCWNSYAALYISLSNDDISVLFTIIYSLHSQEGIENLLGHMSENSVLTILKPKNHLLVDIKGNYNAKKWLTYFAYFCH